MQSEHFQGNTRVVLWKTFLLKLWVQWRLVGRGGAEHDMLNFHKLDTPVNPAPDKETQDSDPPPAPFQEPSPE